MIDIILNAYGIYIALMLTVTILALGLGVIAFIIFLK